MSDEREFSNVYQCMTSLNAHSVAISSETVSFSSITVAVISSATVTNLTVTNIAGIPGRWTQIVTTTSLTSINTTATSYVQTSSSGSITPASATSKILVMVTGVIGCSQPVSDPCRWTIFRNSTDLDTSGNGLLQISNQSVSTDPSNTPGTMIVVDSPGTTSKVAYSVQFKTGSGVSTARWNNHLGISPMYMIEVSQ